MLSSMSVYLEEGRLVRIRNAKVGSSILLLPTRIRRVTGDSPVTLFIWSCPLLSQALQQSKVSADQHGAVRTSILYDAFAAEGMRSGAALKCRSISQGRAKLSGSPSEARLDSWDTDTRIDYPSFPSINTLYDLVQPQKYIGRLTAPLALFTHSRFKPAQAIASHRPHRRLARITQPKFQ